MNHLIKHLLLTIKVLVMMTALTVSPLIAKTKADVRYGKYKQSGLDKPFIKHQDISPVLSALEQQPMLTIQTIGQSFNGTNIKTISVGKGKTHILIWSQMHGDEPTATGAIFDVINYIIDDEQVDWRASWTNKLTLTFMPMLNPDGADKTTRVNAQGIDINRDARALQTPEGKVLMELLTTLKPQFAFNLHDQSRTYGAGNTGNPATVSILAPSYNYQRDINPIRLNAMQLIVDINETIEGQLTDHIGRYDDGYSHRAFGDTFTKTGVSTVLIEAGGYPSDDNRQVARKAIYKMVLAGIDSINTQSYTTFTQAQYESIPLNIEHKIKDLIINNLTINHHKNKNYQTDLIINFDVYGSQKAKIQAIGDASDFSAYHVFDAKDFNYQTGKSFSINKKLTLTDSVYFRLLKQGYSHFVGDIDKLKVSTRFPVMINPSKTACVLPCNGQTATFLLTDGRGIKFAVINGQIIDLRTGKTLNPLGT
ncbi:M14 family zinc carboxypeptidase [Colwellia sp. RSH04]|uniref:M14 family zinc carboxypeptidase n=1 Tax=Colwellia sp. RSH04 TaxID=2305464 RepID=UPI000E56F53D|nr:M14 family zinc carboxypeptidase [Colwellia sp. RSH04]RHW76487.1 peptidase M14 [Colwellia sp. RSH04]